MPRSHLLFVWVVLLAVVFAGLHVALHLTWFGPKLVSYWTLVFTDVRCDWGINTWLSVATMLGAGVAALRLVAVRPRAERRGWLLVAGVLLYLGIDDAFTIHELINDWARRYVGDRYSFPWIKVVLPFFVILGFLVFRFLLRTLDKNPRRLAEVVGAFFCLGCAVGLELLEHRLLDVTWKLRGFTLIQYPVVPEEFLEVLGPALLLLCFTRMREQAVEQAVAETVPLVAPAPVSGDAPRASVG